DVMSDLLAAYSSRPPAPQPLLTTGTGVDIASQIAPLAAGLLFAGHETTVAAIDKGIVLLLTNPTQREALQHDSTLIPSAVEEILRHPLPVPTPETPDMPVTPEKPVTVDTGRAGGLPRYANADIELAGATIRAGDLVLLDLQDANLDAQRFPLP